jgi:hypothetical protein
MVKVKRSIFVLSVMSEDILNDKVLHNYITRAIKRYYDVAKDEQSFDGVAMPTFRLSQPLSYRDSHKKEDLVVAIQRVKEVEAAVNFVNEEIDFRSTRDIW